MSKSTDAQAPTPTPEDQENADKYEWDGDFPNGTGGYIADAFLAGLLHERQRQAQRIAELEEEVKGSNREIGRVRAARDAYEKRAEQAEAKVAELKEALRGESRAAGHWMREANNLHNSLIVEVQMERDVALERAEQAEAKVAELERRELEHIADCMRLSQRAEQAEARLAEAVTKTKIETYKEAARKVRLYSPGDSLDGVFDALANQLAGSAARPAPVNERCVHDVHGKDCFKCFPAPAGENGRGA